MLLFFTLSQKKKKKRKKKEEEKEEEEKKKNGMCACMRNSGHSGTKTDQTPVHGFTVKKVMIRSCSGCITLISLAVPLWSIGTKHHFIIQKRRRRRRRIEEKAPAQRG